MPWAVTDQPSGVHVIPLDDLILHEASMDCTCSPSVVQIGYTCLDHGNRWAIRTRYTHNAMDGRID